MHAAAAPSLQGAADGDDTMSCIICLVILTEYASIARRAGGQSHTAHQEAAPASGRSPSKQHHCSHGESRHFGQRRFCPADVMHTASFYDNNLINSPSDFSFAAANPNAFGRTFTGYNT